MEGKVISYLKERAVYDALMAATALCFIGLIAIVYGLNYTNADNRIAAVDYFNSEAEGYDIIQIFEDPFANKVSICGVNRFVVSPRTRCMTYTVKSGFVYDVTPYKGDT